MGFQDGKIPYPLYFGLDIPYYYHKLDQKTVFSYFSKLDEIKFDYLISNISIEDTKIRSNGVNNNFPIYLNDYLLFSQEWKSRFVAKLHDNDCCDIKSNYEIMLNDLEYASHISTRYIIINFKIEMFNDLVIFSKLIRTFISKSPEKQVYIVFDLDSGDNLRFWNQIQSLCGYLPNLGVILRIQPDLPKEVCIYQLKYLLEYYQ